MKKLQSTQRHERIQSSFNQNAAQRDDSILHDLVPSHRRTLDHGHEQLGNEAWKSGCNQSPGTGTAAVVEWMLGGVGIESAGMLTMSNQAMLRMMLGARGSAPLKRNIVQILEDATGDPLPGVIHERMARAFGGDFMDAHIQAEPQLHYRSLSSSVPSDPIASNTPLSAIPAENAA